MDACASAAKRLIANAHLSLTFSFMHWQDRRDSTQPTSNIGLMVPLAVVFCCSNSHGNKVPTTPCQKLCNNGSGAAGAPMSHVLDHLQTHQRGRVSQRWTLVWERLREGFVY